MQTVVEPEPARATEEPAPVLAAPRRFTVELVERWQDLQAETEAWDELAARAVEPNPFYAPAAVLAALRHLAPAGQPAFLVVRGHDSDTSEFGGAWCGFFPFMRFARYRGLWLPNLRLLTHDYCFLRVPLVRADCVADVLRHAFAWLAQSGCALVELADQIGDGVYADALAAQLRASGGHAWLLSSHARAFLRRAPTSETYLRQAISGSKLKELRRQERRLREKGELRFESVPANGDVDLAIDEFLALERGGWKGAQGTAMACRPADSAFFRELLRHAWRADQLRIIALRLDGRAVAMKCNFLAPPGSFAFKIAYAEELAAYSPGVLLELENIRRIHTEAWAEWMDSCAAPGHPMIERLWKERRAIHSWVLPQGLRGRTATVTLSLLQRARRTILGAYDRLRSVVPQRAARGAPP
jgi:CelD/BcsL family acetyltransferase involved in cellulose biosynthesis